MTGIFLLAWLFVSPADRDTSTVREGNEHLKVRLAEVDALERTQSCSQVSRKGLDSLCRNKEV
jgi:endonuclease YncB( thermonuclease family)